MPLFRTETNPNIPTSRMNEIHAGGRKHPNCWNQQELCNMEDDWHIGSVEDGDTLSKDSMLIEQSWKNSWNGEKKEAKSQGIGSLLEAEQEKAKAPIGGMRRTKTYDHSLNDLAETYAAISFEDKCLQRCNTMGCLRS